MRKSDIPNLISVLRIILIFPVIWLLARQEYQAALILFILAGISDGVDGYLARRWGWGSRLGGWLDPIADKLMQVSAYIMLAWLQLIPYWLLVAVITRDIVIVAGGAFYYFRIEKVSAAPSWISKVNTLMQIVLVAFILIHQGVYPFSTLLIEILIYTVLVTTVISGADYVITWGVRAWRVKRRIRT